ncbi:MAG: prepilin-type N-terminal cleavage/methylation domain-containing protein [Clostridiales bacterium]|nr:prepilin-type N-terminal cleavage/methylation domain-containing protein [Clostridiales bacterium]
MYNGKGVTLIELLCIIAILGVLSAIAIPEIVSTIDKWVLDSTAKEIVEDIRWTQHLATTKGIYHHFEVNLKENLYRIRSIALRDPTIKRVEFNPNISEITCTFKSEGDFKRLTFSPTGIPSQTGSITLTSKKGNELTITVAVGTGRVEIKS